MQKLKTKPRTNKNKYAILLTILALILVVSVYYSTIWQIAAPYKNPEDKAKTESPLESVMESPLLPTLEKHYNLESQVIQSEDGNSSPIQPTTVQDTKTLNLTCDKAKLQAYRRFLFDINILVLNFFQDKVYTEQINEVNKVKLPENMKAILDSLNEYNAKFLINPNYQPQRIFPINSKLIEKFIRIEQESSSAKEKKNLRAHIIENLESFIGFFYSDKLQQEFIE
jgi:hypothetical protein